MKNLIVLIIIMVLLGCSSQDADHIPEEFQHIVNLTVYSAEKGAPYQIELVREQSFGDTDDVLIGRMGQVVVDSHGRVYLADLQQKDIKVFDPNGDFIKQLGRSGRGPGEFEAITDVQITYNRLFVYDAIQYMILAFSLESFDHEYDVLLGDSRMQAEDEQDEAVFLFRPHIRSDHSILMIYRMADHSGNRGDWDLIPINHLLYLLDSAGAIKQGPILTMPALNEIIVPAPGRPAVGMYFDFMGRALYALSSEDRIYRVWTDDFLIKVFQPTGEFIHAFYYPVEGVPLTPEAAFEYQDGPIIRDAIQNVNFPQTWPVVGDFLLDDEDRIWVAAALKDSEVYHWYVLENTGELLARFQWPGGRNIEMIRDGYLYARETDDETGLQTAVRYRIEKN